MVQQPFVGCPGVLSKNAKVILYLKFKTATMKLQLSCRSNLCDNPATIIETLVPHCTLPDTSVNPNAVNK